jgi:hypothetical protein
MVKTDGYCRQRLRVSPIHRIEFVKLNGMSCTRQKMISWGNPLLIDCFTTIVNSPDLPGEIIRNSNFMKEAASIKSEAHEIGKSLA